MKTIPRTAACALLAALASPAFADSPAQPYGYGRVPAWVRVADVPLAGGAPLEAGQSDYLLVDNQVRLTDVQSHYQRYVEKLVNQSSVDDSAQISVDIDPEHEFVDLHEVRVFRDGRAIDKLADARRSLLDQEDELDDGLINGRKTLHLLLQDVRVGDVLDYSFTLVRRDPFGEHGYHDFFRTQWTVPVRRYRLRVLRPADRALHVSDHGKLPAPRESRADGWVETTWDAPVPVGIVEEEHKPGWFFQFPRIEITEFADWDAVRAWAMPMYVVEAGNDAALAELVAQTRAEPSMEARILKALRFVQDDVRYTGLEIGAGAYRPTQPKTVLARRFGDCKDKTLLLITVLRALGLEAWPALVHTHVGRGISQRAPSPGAFNHVIAKVRAGGATYWLDSTVSGQGGSLATLTQASFGEALVLAPGAHGLEKMPEGDATAPSITVVETYDLRKGTGETADFEVRTTYRREDADEMRVTLQTSTATELGRGYLDYYRKRHKGVRATQPVEIADDRANDVITIVERYAIDTPFRKSSDGDRTFGFEAYLVSDRTGAPDDTERTTPLARIFPMHVHHEIVAYLPGEWDIDPDDTRIANASFEYDSRVRFSGNKLMLSYDLRNKRDHVPAAAFADFVEQLDEAHDDAFFTLTEGADTATASSAAHASTPDSSSTTGGAASTDQPARTGINLPFVLALVFGGGVGAALAAFVWRTNPRVPPARENAPTGVAGWMWVIVLTILFVTIRLVEQLLHHWWQTGNAPAFARLDLATKIVTLVQVGLLALGVAVSALLANLLFRRRNAFAATAIGAMALWIVILFAQGLLVALNDAARDADTALATTSLLAACLAACAWIPYLQRSERVRATFRAESEAWRRGEAELPAAPTGAPSMAPASPAAGTTA